MVQNFFLAMYKTQGLQHNNFNEISPFQDREITLDEYF